MNIILFQHDSIAILPPLISMMRLLSELGHRIYYIGATDTAAAREILSELGVSFALYPFRAVRFCEHPIIRIWQGVTRCIRPYVVKIWAWKKIRRFEQGCSNPVILWAQSFLSAAILGNHAISRGRSFVCTLYDLGDENGKDLHGFDSSRFYQNVTLVECEYNRAHILMAQKNLPRLPFVLPNKPYPHPQQRNLAVTDAAAARVVESWGARRVFLYQGALQRDRGDLFQMLEALCKGFPECVVSVMGAQNEATEALARKYSNFSHVPRVSPPHHLEVTSHAHIGLAVYKGEAIYGLDPLNAVYCAPNKIFECAGFGIPMLCNDLPGLRYSIGLAKAGECIETVDELHVCDAARKILLNYDVYSQNATRFYESVDLPTIVQRIIDFAGGKE